MRICTLQEFSESSSIEEQAELTKEVGLRFTISMLNSWCDVIVDAPDAIGVLEKFEKMSSGYPPKSFLMTLFEERRGVSLSLTLENVVMTSLHILQKETEHHAMDYSQFQ
jgi:hypothetical protein